MRAIDVDAVTDVVGLSPRDAAGAGLRALRGLSIVDVIAQLHEALEPLIRVDDFGKREDDGESLRNAIEHQGVYDVASQALSVAREKFVSSKVVAGAAAAAQSPSGLGTVARGRDERHVSSVGDGDGWDFSDRE